LVNIGFGQKMFNDKYNQDLKIDSFIVGIVWRKGVKSEKTAQFGS